MRCPKCDHEQPDGALECAKCGVVFAKLGARSRAAVPARGLSAPQPIPSSTWKLVGLGVALAVVSQLLPFVRFVFSYLGILVHELGHAATAWLFGYPAVPAFDFVSGGGVAIMGRRSGAVVLVIAALLVAAAIRVRAHRRALALVLVIGVAWGLVAWSRWHEMVILAMGRGAELVTAVVFGYRALSGSAVHHDVERSLYAACAAFLWIGEVRFFGAIVLDPDFRLAYEEYGKLGWHMMDWSRVADEFFFVPIEAVAAPMLLLVFAAVPAAWLLALRREQIRERVVAFLSGE